MPFSQYAPTNETGADLWLERSNLNGAQLGAMAYGILVAICIQCVVLLWSPRYEKRDWPLLLYTCLMFTLGSLGNAANMRLNELTFIDARNFPGGPNGFVVTEYNYWVGATAVICFTIASWLQDGLMLYRLWVIWDGGYQILIFPAMILLASSAIVISCFLMVQLTRPGENLWTTINFSLLYWSLSIALNTISTGLIVSRLLVMRHQVRAALGANHSGQYISVAAILIESAALNSVIGLVFIISYARKSNVQNLFGPVLGQVQSISPLLIIMRVAQGRARPTETVPNGTSGTIQWNQTTRSHNNPTTTPARVSLGDIAVTNNGLKADSAVASRTESYDLELVEYTPHHTPQAPATSGPLYASSSF